MSDLMTEKHFLNFFEGTRQEKYNGYHALLNTLVHQLNKDLHWASGEQQCHQRKTLYQSANDVSLYGVLQRITFKPKRYELLAHVDLLPGTVVGLDDLSDHTRPPFQQIRTLKQFSPLELRNCITGMGELHLSDGLVLTPGLPMSPQQVWCRPSYNKHLLNKGKISFKRAYIKYGNSSTPLLFAHYEHRTLLTLKMDVTDMAISAGLRFR